MSSTRRFGPTSARSAAPSLILGCGDLPFEYLGRLMNALDVPLVFVPGNHDPDLSGYRVSRAGLTLRAGLPARPPWPDGAVSADGRVVDVAGLRIAGLGGCRRYSPGPNQYSDRQQARRARRLAARARLAPRGRREVDVLLTHAPPRGVGDGPIRRTRASPPSTSWPAAAPGAAAARARGPDPAGATTAGAASEHRLAAARLVSATSPAGSCSTRAGARRPAERRHRHVTGGPRAMPADTGFPRADVENDFQRARRRQVLARLAQRLRREPDDVNLILPFDEVVAALGRTGERRLGLQEIKLDTVVGTVDSTRDFDRRFRPTSGRVRERWERLALAQRRGESIPPIDVYRVGDLHFVVDGHHRVSIALATGQKTIDAYVTEILTAVPAQGIRAPRRPAVQELRAAVPVPGQATRPGLRQDHLVRSLVLRGTR